MSKRQITLGQIPFGANFSWVQFPFWWAKHVLSQFTLDQKFVGPFSVGFKIFELNLCWTAISWDKFLLSQNSLFLG